jgi:hypothetical protein
LPSFDKDHAKAYPEFITDGVDTQLADFSCDYGIDRWLHESNSQDTFDKAFAGSDKWQDPLFPADKTSLYWKDFPTRKAYMTASLDKVSHWKSPPEIDPENIPKFYGDAGKPQPQGISQNKLGDCWFLAGAAAIAEDPKRFGDLVDEKNRATNYNKAGIFRFSFWIMSELVSINIDDRLPVEEYWENYYVYASGKSIYNAWWMPLMEKAFAKLNTNYDRIQLGSGIESLRQLSNKPVLHFEHRNYRSDVDKTWTEMHRLLG